MKHSWESRKTSCRDDDVAVCRNCGLYRFKEFLEDTCYKAKDGRFWRRIAPPCPPERLREGDDRRYFSGGRRAE